MRTEYSSTQLDALREIANIGSGSASTALSGVLGRPVDISVPNALALPLADAVDAAGPADAEVTAVVIPIGGDLDGLVLMLFGIEDAQRLCELLGVDAGTEIGLSALSEIGNILGTSYVNSLAAMTGLELEPAPPQTVTDMLAAVVATVLSASAGEEDLALLLDSNMHVEGEACSLTFMFVPGPAGVDEVLGRLGLAE